MDSITLDTVSKVQFTIDDVESVYVGKPDHCMCGCAGKYTYTKKSQKKAGKSRGYSVGDDEVGDKRVARIVSKVKNCSVPIENVDDRIFTAVIGKTQYTIYLFKEGRK